MNKVILAAIKILTVFVIIILHSSCDFSDSEGPIPPPAPNCPIPGYYKVISLNRTSLKIEWEDLNANGVNGYQYSVKRSSIGHNNIVVLINGTTDNYFIDNNLDFSNKYYYEISVSKLNESDSNIYFYVEYGEVHNFKTVINFPADKLLMSNNNSYLAAVSNNILSVWRESDQLLFASTTDQAEYIPDFHFSADNSKIYFASDSTIKSIDLDYTNVADVVKLNNKCDYFTFNRELNKVLTHVKETGTLECYDISGNLLWYIDNVGNAGGLFYNKLRNEFIALTSTGIKALRPQDGHLNYSYPFSNAIYYSPQLYSDSSIIKVSVETTQQDYMFALQLETGNYTLGYYDISLFKNSKYIESTGHYYMGVKNCLVEYDPNNYGNEILSRYSPVVNYITDIEYCRSNGDIIISEKNNSIHIYSASKSDQWYTYPTSIY